MATLIYGVKQMHWCDSTEQALTSTSISSEAALTGPAKSVIGLFHSKRIDFLSTAPEQMEVVFPPGTRFEVTERETDEVTGIITITMEKLESRGN